MDRAGLGVKGSRSLTLGHGAAQPAVGTVSWSRLSATSGPPSQHSQGGSALHVWSPSWPVSARGSIPSVGSQRLFAEDTSGQEGAVGLGPGLGTHGPPVTVAGAAGRPVGGLWKHPHQRRQVKWKRNRRGRFCHRFRWATSSNSGLRAAVCTMRRISSTEVAVKIYNSRKVYNERPTSKIGQQS